MPNVLTVENLIPYQTKSVLSKIYRRTTIMKKASLPSITKNHRCMKSISRMVVYNSELLIRHTSSHVVILAERVIQSVLRLIHSSCGLHCIERLCAEKSVLSRTSRGDIKLTVPIRLPAPTLSPLLSHHIPPPSPFPLSQSVFAATTAPLS